MLLSDILYRAVVISLVFKVNDKKITIIMNNDILNYSNLLKHDIRVKVLCNIKIVIIIYIMYFDTPIKALMLQIVIVFIELIVTI